ncbi:MAG: hypothetical protein ABW187_08065 [Dokdonella sp.]
MAWTVGEDAPDFNFHERSLAIGLRGFLGGIPHAPHSPMRYGAAALIRRDHERMHGALEAAFVHCVAFSEMSHGRHVRAVLGAARVIRGGGSVVLDR